MDGVIELIRQCSSRMNTKMLRGTVSGQVLEYNINSIFCLASIQPYLPTQADISRFFTIEMNSNENIDPILWIKIQKLFMEIEHFAPRLFARMVKLIPIIKQNIIDRYYIYKLRKYLRYYPKDIIKIINNYIYNPKHHLPI